MQQMRLTRNARNQLLSAGHVRTLAVLRRCLASSAIDPPTHLLQRTVAFAPQLKPKGNKYMGRASAGQPANVDEALAEVREQKRNWGKCVL